MHGQRGGRRGAGARRSSARRSRLHRGRGVRLLGRRARDRLGDQPRRRRRHPLARLRVRLPRLARLLHGGRERRDRARGGGGRDRGRDRGERRPGPRRISGEPPRGDRGRRGRRAAVPGELLELGRGALAGRPLGRHERRQRPRRPPRRDPAGDARSDLHSGRALRLLSVAGDLLRRTARRRGGRAAALATSGRDARSGAARAGGFGSRSRSCGIRPDLRARRPADGGGARPPGRDRRERAATPASRRRSDSACATAATRSRCRGSTSSAAAARGTPCP